LSVLYRYNQYSIPRYANHDAGIPINVCTDTTFIQMAATVQFAANVSWTTTGSGSFDDPGLLNPVYTFDPAEIIAGDSIMFFVETFNFSGCPDDEDSVWLYFNAPPTMNSVLMTLFVQDSQFR
jgi:hypothetical protein